MSHNWYRFVKAAGRVAVNPVARRLVSTKIPNTANKPLTAGAVPAPKPVTPPLLARPPEQQKQPNSAPKYPYVQTEVAPKRITPGIPQASGWGPNGLGGMSKRTVYDRPVGAQTHPGNYAPRTGIDANGVGLNTSASGMGLGGTTQTDAVAAINRYLASQRLKGPLSLEDFQFAQEQANPGAIQRARDKADRGSYAAQGIEAPEYTVRKGMTFTPTNEEQARRMGVLGKTEGTFVNPELYQPETRNMQRGWAKGRNETTGATAAITTPSYAFPDRQAALPSNLKKVSSQTLFKVAARDWANVPSKPLTTIGGKAIDTTPSPARLARDAEAQKLIQQNEQTVQRGQADIRSLWQKANELKSQMAGQRAQHEAEMGDMNDRITRAGVASPKPEQAAKEPQAPTVSQLERMYRNYGVGTAASTPAAQEAVVDEAGRTVRADRQAYLRRAIAQRAKLMRRPREIDSGVSSFWRF